MGLGRVGGFDQHLLGPGRVLRASGIASASKDCASLFLKKVVPFPRGVHTLSLWTPLAGDDSALARCHFTNPKRALVAGVESGDREIDEDVRGAELAV